MYRQNGRMNCFMWVSFTVHFERNSDYDCCNYNLHCACLFWRIIFIVHRSVFAWWYFKLYFISDGIRSMMDAADQMGLDGIRLSKEQVFNIYGMWHVGWSPAGSHSAQTQHWTTSMTYGSVHKQTDKKVAHSCRIAEHAAEIKYSLNK